MPTARNKLANSVINNVLYAIGGTNGNSLANLEAYISFKQ